MEIGKVSDMRITRILALAGMITVVINVGMLFIPLDGDSSLVDAYLAARESRQSLIELAEKSNVTVEIPDLLF